MGTKTFVDSLSVHVCSLVKFFAEVVKTPTVCDGLFSISPEVCSVKLDLKVAIFPSDLITYR